MARHQTYNMRNNSAVKQDFYRLSDDLWKGWYDNLTAGEQTTAAAAVYNILRLFVIATFIFYNNDEEHYKLQQLSSAESASHNYVRKMSNDILIIILTRARVHTIINLEYGSSGFRFTSIDSLASGENELYAPII